MALKSIPSEPTCDVHSDVLAAPRHPVEPRPHLAAATRPLEDTARHAAEGPNDPPADPAAARLAANRANAQHSTGPTTPEGKARVARNALKHGLFAREANLALEALGEDLAEFAALLADLMQDWAPGDRREEELVHSIAELQWRLARLQYTARSRLEQDLAEGMDALAAVRRSESIGPDEGRLQRALSRLNRDLIHLQKYRLSVQERQRKREAKPSRYGMRDIMAEFNADTERLVQALNRRSEQREDAFEDEESSEELEVLDTILKRENAAEGAAFSHVDPEDNKEFTQRNQGSAKNSTEQSHSIRRDQAA